MRSALQVFHSDALAYRAFLQPGRGY